METGTKGLDISSITIDLDGSSLSFQGEAVNSSLFLDKKITNVSSVRIEITNYLSSDLKVRVKEIKTGIDPTKDTHYIMFYAESDFSGKLIDN